MSQSMKLLNEVKHSLEYMRLYAAPLMRFRRAIRMVIILKYAISSFNSKHINKAPKLTINNGAINTNRISHRPRRFERTKSKSFLQELLYFDLKQFKRTKDISISDEAKHILRMPSENRQDEHVQTALTSLVECVPEFKDFPIDIQRKIIKRCELQEFEAGRVIIRQNHSADNFYFIVSGITSVSTLRRNSLTGELQNQLVAFLAKGRSFGDIAIMHGASRNATVMCHTDISVLSINRDDFVDLFMHSENGKEPEHITYLKRVKLLLDWPIHKLPHDKPRICCLNFFRKNIVICRDNLVNEWIYFIKQGTCRIIKKIKLMGDDVDLGSGHTSSRRSSRISLTFPPSRSLAAETTSKKRTTEAIKTTHPDGDIGDEDGTVFIEIQKLTAKDTFGLVEILFNAENETSSVSLISDGVECILLSKKFFLDHLTEDMKLRLKNQVMPYPTELDLQRKYRRVKHWNEYRKCAFRNMMRGKQ